MCLNQVDVPFCVCDIDGYVFRHMLSRDSSSPLFCMVLLEYRRLGLLSKEAERLALLALVV